jgi:5-(carboxyamino)imidazole ribonucleotide mutase
MEPQISIIIGSESDRNIAEKAENILKRFGVEYEIKVLSAHRNHQKLEEYIRCSGVNIFIAIAGLSAQLPGFIASLTIRPVIGVPVASKLEGLDSLLSIVQMPSGVPVACVGIDNSSNAALIAIEILALSDTKLKDKLFNFREGLL